MRLGVKIVLAHIFNVTRDVPRCLD